VSVGEFIKRVTKSIFAASSRFGKWRFDLILKS
jgi:hypothetical protein